MSIVNQPSALGRRHLPKKKDFQAFSLKVTIQTTDIPLRKVEEFLDFLTLVYGKKFRITQKNSERTICLLYLYERTEAGLRVASWMYRFNYDTARVYV